MEEAPENGKESSHSAHANGIEWNSISSLNHISQNTTEFTNVSGFTLLLMCSTIYKCI
jgi:hypothetical protein